MNKFEGTLARFAQETQAAFERADKNMNYLKERIEELEEEIMELQDSKKVFIKGYQEGTQAERDYNSKE